MSLFCLGFIVEGIFTKTFFLRIVIMVSFKFQQYPIWVTFPYSSIVLINMMRNDIVVIKDEHIPMEFASFICSFCD